MRAALVLNGLKYIIIDTVGTYFVESFTIYQSRQNNDSKIWAFDASGAFRDKVTPDIVFKVEVIVQCDVPVSKIPF